MEDKEFLRKLRVAGTPDQFDKWFEAASYCYLGGGKCCDCPAHLPEERPGGSRCGISRLFPRNPFCTAFHTCTECGINCDGSEFDWLQDMLDRCEAVGLFKCPGSDACWKGDDCYTCNFVPCRECRLFQHFAMVCEAGFDQVPWDCRHVIKAAA